MWNASNVHKQSSKVWQEKMVDPSWNSVRGMLSTSLLWRRFWCNRTQNKNARLRQQCRNWNSFERQAGTWLSRLPLMKMKKIEQVRGLSVPNPYHCATDASSLDGDIWSTLHPPAYIERKSCWPNNKSTKQTERSFTSVQMVHTHTNTHTHFLTHNLLTHNLLTSNSLTRNSLIRTSFTQPAFHHIRRTHTYFFECIV